MTEENENKENVVASDDATEEISGPSLEEQLEKSKQDYLYLYADFENYKKKALQERSQLVKYANEYVLRDLLHILDNFKLAVSMDVNADNLKSYVDGVNMIAHELSQMMERYGVTPVKSDGEFDPNIHEAVSTEESDDKSPGEIITVFKEGYKLHDRLLRPAQVVIAAEAKKD